VGKRRMNLCHPQVRVLKGQLLGAPTVRPLSHDEFNHFHRRPADERHAAFVVLDVRIVDLFGRCTHWSRVASRSDPGPHSVARSGAPPPRSTTSRTTST